MTKCVYGIQPVAFVNFKSKNTTEVPARIELATICVLSRCDNHYTTEPH